MGAEQSGCNPFAEPDEYHKIGDFKWVYRIKNDYELAIRLSKELEYYLTVYFQATGKGLHEKITSAERGYNAKHPNDRFPHQLVRSMRRLATIRNKLIHERSFHAIDDRRGFIRTFEDSCQELKVLIAKMNGNKDVDGQGQCVIL